MRNKIQNSFHELPPESRESLRDALLIHISQITQLTNKVIVTHLCLALADLALLMSAWRNPVLDLIDKFSNRPDLLAPLLEILTLLPEEVNSRYLRLGANRRDEIVKELEANANAVHEFLCQCVTTANSAQQQHQAGDQQRAALPFDPDTIQTWAVKCFTSWVSVSAIQVSYFASSIQSKESILMRKQNVNNLPPFSGNFLLLISLSLVPPSGLRHLGQCDRVAGVLQAQSRPLPVDRGARHGHGLSHDPPAMGRDVSGESTTGDATVHVRHGAGEGVPGGELVRTD